MCDYLKGPVQLDIDLEKEVLKKIKLNVKDNKGN